MKAKEYFEKYKDAIFNEWVESKGESCPSAVDMLKDFLDEISPLMVKRNIKSDGGAIAVLRELNEKWNAVVKMFERRHGPMLPLQYDAFKKVWINQYPWIEKDW